MRTLNGFAVWEKSKVFPNCLEWYVNDLIDAHNRDAYWKWQQEAHKITQEEMNEDYMRKLEIERERFEFNGWDPSDWL